MREGGDDGGVGASGETLCQRQDVLGESGPFAVNTHDKILWRGIGALSMAPGATHPGIVEGAVSGLGRR